MTDKIRKAVKVELVKQGRRQAEVVQAIGVTRQHLSRMLSDHAKSGGLSRAWEKLLAEMGLEVVVQPRAERS
jgi:predicted XRE-type DNA-binding protein